MRAEDIDLARMLAFRPEEGKVLLNGRRMVIFSQQALRALYQSVTTHLGHELAAAILSQFGMRSGREDYQSIAEVGDWDSDLDRIASGPVMHMWEGLVHVSPLEFGYDRSAGELYMIGEWRNSYEAEIYLEAFGISTTPVCWSLTGYASGWASEFLGAEVVAIETSCIGAGDDMCRFELRPAQQWDSRAEPWQRALRATTDSVTSLMETTVAQRTAELTETNRQLEAARQATDEALRVKSEFLAKASHELRTPLNGIIGVAELLRSSGLNPEQRRLVDVIIEAGSQQVGVVSDILDYASLEAGKPQVNKAEIDVNHLLDSVVQVFTPMATARGVQLTVQPSDGPIDELETDALRLRQILTALVSNAIKFTDPGGVVDIACASSEGTVAISVADTGIGMSTDSVARLFEPFEPADSSSTRSFGGTGLGLAICRELAELIGVRIEVTSRVGRGTTFTVLVPRSATAETTATPHQPLATAPPDSSEGIARDWEPLRALVAEDNRINAVVITKMLESLGVVVTTVADGAAAVEASDAEEFDLIALDLHLPEMDGVEVVAHIRVAELERGQAAHLVAALTADGLEETRQRCLAAGFSEFMTKPVRKDEIAGLVARAATLRSVRQR